MLFDFTNSSFGHKLQSRYTKAYIQGWFFILGFCCTTVCYGWVGGWVRACARAWGEELNPSISNTLGFGMPSTQRLPYLTSEKRSQNILKNSRYSVNKGLSIRSLDMSILSFLVLNIDFQLMKWNLTLMMIISFI